MCVTNLFTDHLSGGPNNGGTWEFDGWRATYLAPGDPSPIQPITGGSNPASAPQNTTGGQAIDTIGITLTGGHSIDVDWTDATPGYYYFTYTVGNVACQDDEQIVVEVLDIPEYTPNNYSECEDEAAPTFDLNTLVSPSPPGCSGCWTQSSGITPVSINSQNVITNFDQLDSDGGGPGGTYTLTYTQVIEEDSGNGIGDTIINGGACDGCDTVEFTIIIDILAAGNAGTDNPQAVCNA